MIDFNIILSDTINKYAGKDVDDKWMVGDIDIEFLNQNFAQYGTAQEMIDATESEGLKLYFSWLKDQGILPN